MATAGGEGQPSLTLRLANPQDTLLRVRVAGDPSIGIAASLDGSSSGAAEDDGSAATEAENSASRAGGKDRTSPRAGGTREDPGASPAGATAAPSTAAGIDVTVTPKLGRSKSEWVRLEGKEDEFLRQPGDRHRLPDGLLRLDGGGNNVGGAGNDDSGGGGCATPVLLHQQGDVAWVQVPLGVASADRVRAAVVAAGSPPAAAVVVTVRLFLVMGEGEEESGGEGKGASGGGDVWMPIAVRFPLSKCLP